MTEVHQVIHQEILLRITQALSSLDEAMALQAMEMDEDTHHIFLHACQRAAALQNEMECLSVEDTSLPTFQTEEKEKMASDSSKTDKGDFTLIVPKAMKPLQEPESHKALNLEQCRLYTD